MTEMKPGEQFKWAAFADYWDTPPVRRHPHHDRVRRRHGAHQRAEQRPDPGHVPAAEEPGQGDRGHGRARAPQRRDRRVASVHHAHRRQAVRRRARASGVPAHRRPPADDRPGLQRPGRPGQRHVRPVRCRHARSSSSACRTSSRPSRCSSRPATTTTSPSSSSPPPRRWAATRSRRRRCSRSRPRRPASRSTSRRPTRPRFYGKDYLSWPFAQDFWATRGYLQQASQGTMAGAPYNETHWKNAEWASLVDKAFTTVDDDDAQRSHRPGAADRVRHGRLHHLVVAQPGRRLLQDDHRLQAGQARRSDRPDVLQGRLLRELIASTAAAAGAGHDPAPAARSPRRAPPDARPIVCSTAARDPVPPVVPAREAAIMISRTERGRRSSCPRF